MSCEHGNHVAGCDICDAIDAAYKSGYVAGGIAALAKAPEASGADYVMVPRKATFEMLEAGRTMAPSHWAEGTAFDRNDVAELWGLMLAAAPKANPAPPTSGVERIEGMEFYLHEDPDSDHEVEPVRLVMSLSHNNKVFCHRATQGDNGVCKPTPADESGAFNALADDEAERQQYERDKLDPSNCLTTPTAEPREAAQDDEYDVAMRLRAAFVEAHDREAEWLDNSGHLYDPHLPTDAGIRAVLRLQPSGAAEDAARYRWLTDDHADRATRVRCREILSRIGVMSYSAACTDIDAAMADAARRARGGEA